MQFLLQWISLYDGHDFLAYLTGFFLLDTCSNGLSLTAGSERKAQLSAALNLAEGPAE